MNSGVYVIINTVNGLTYVGSSVNLERRIVRHCNELRRGVHYNKQLQRSWDKYGKYALEYTILEYCEPELVRIREQSYIDQFVSLGVKLSNTAIVDVTKPQLGNIVSDETRQKLSNSNRGRKFTDEEKLNISIKVKARWAQPEYREIFMNGVRKRPSPKKRIKKGPNPDANSKTYYFILNGEDVVIFNLARYCRDHGIKEEKLRDVAAGRRRSHKGYTKKS